MTIYLQ